MIMPGTSLNGAIVLRNIPSPAPSKKESAPAASDSIASTRLRKPASAPQASFRYATRSDGLEISLVFKKISSAESISLFHALFHRQKRTHNHSGKQKKSNREID